MVVCSAVLLAWGVCFQGISVPQPTVDTAAAMTKWGNVDLLPPEAYDRPYKGKISISVIDSKEGLETRCKLTTPKLIACAWTDSTGTCNILRRDDKYLESIAMPIAWVIKHETAHCNGWDKQHLGMRKPHKGDL